MMNNQSVVTHGVIPIQVKQIAPFKSENNFIQTRQGGSRTTSLT